MIAHVGEKSSADLIAGQQCDADTFKAIFSDVDDLNEYLSRDDINGDVSDDIKQPTDDFTNVDDYSSLYNDYNDEDHEDEDDDDMYQDEDEDDEEDWGWRPRIPRIRIPRPRIRIRLRSIANTLKKHLNPATAFNAWKKTVLNTLNPLNFVNHLKSFPVIGGTLHRLAHKAIRTVKNSVNAATTKLLPKELNKALQKTAQIVHSIRQETINVVGGTIDDIQGEFNQMVRDPLGYTKSLAVELAAELKSTVEDAAYLIRSGFNLKGLLDRYKCKVCTDVVKAARFEMENKSGQVCKKLIRKLAKKMALRCKKAYPACRFVAKKACKFALEKAVKLIFDPARLCSMSFFGIRPCPNRHAGSVAIRMPPPFEGIPEPISDGNYFIIPLRNTRMAVDLPVSHANGRPRLWHYNGNKHQIWRLTRRNNNFEFTIKSPWANKCFDIIGWKRHNNAEAGTWHCHPRNANQLFQFLKYRGSNWVMIRVKHTGLCLAYHGARLNHRLHQWPCTDVNNPNFRFYLKPIARGPIRLPRVRYALVPVVAPDSNMDLGCPRHWHHCDPQIYTKHHGNNQKWDLLYIHGTSNEYRIRNADAHQGHKCLEAFAFHKHVNSRVSSHACHFNTNQRFWFYKHGHYYIIKNRHSNRCITATGTHRHARFVQQDCDPQNHYQRFNLIAK